MFTIGCCSLPMLLNHRKIQEWDVLSQSLIPRFSRTQGSAMHAHLLNSDPQTLPPSTQIQKFWRPKVVFSPLAAKPTWPGGQFRPHRVWTFTFRTDAPWWLTTGCCPGPAGHYTKYSLRTEERVYGAKKLRRISDPKSIQQGPTDQKWPESSC